MDVDAVHVLLSHLHPNRFTILHCHIAQDDKARHDRVHLLESHEVERVSYIRLLRLEDASSAYISFRNAFWTLAKNATSWSSATA